MKVDDDDNDDDDEDVKTSGSTLPSFGQARVGTGAGVAPNRKSPMLMESSTFSPADGPGKSSSPLSKKRKLEADVTSPDSAGPTPKKKPAQSKKKGLEKKAGEKDGGSAIDGPSPSKVGAASKDAGVSESNKDDADMGKGDGDGADRQGGDHSRAGSEDEGEVGSDADEDAKFDEMQKQREKAYLGSCTEEEWQRYGALRASKLDNQAAKALIAQASDQPAAALGKQLVFTITGVAKMLVGELVDEARLVRHECSDDPSRPIQPRHIREAHRRMLRAGRIPECCPFRPKMRRR